ncbi:nucleic acid/nucleotide deaminase of polymorphic system toxin [Saccharopolyspora spinosa]|uniref:Nucleic acid/nucleotide deaminase of polymorphic system toxin n=2 Tax=Saccharopolyspora spinosa TaxID=60894 RepID=A0A2N3XRI5_SACSN|nr:nucleic acid/nucleotide deaminase of polymorphic system toxin [Saccharopolyspora spinosa]
MSRLEDLAARLTAILAALPTTQLTHAHEKLTAAANRLTSIGTGSQNELLHRSQQRLADAAHHADQAAANLRTTAEHLTSYLADPVGISAPDTTSWKPPSYRPTMNAPARPAPLHRRHLAALPERSNRRSPTTGILTTADGTKLDIVRSGRHGPGTGGPGLIGRWQHMASANDHAEGHAAALLREHAFTEATLYVNNRPCPGELGCDATLPAQLPAGARLTVYWPGGYQVYEGTGEGLQR